jgi:hypothetical protein
LTRLLESLRLIRELCPACPPGECRSPELPPAQLARALGWVEGWRGEVLVALNWRRWPHRPLPLPRPVVAELAGAGARGDRQHRSGLPAHQQVLQPQLLGARPLMWQTLRQIVRVGIVTEPPPAVDDAVLAEVRRIQDELLGILGQALAIREVDAGSCNGCELEIHALNNPYYNIEGLGIRFVASPRHADMLLVTGPVSRHMEEALRRTYDATPEPRLVVAVGDCGCTAASSARATPAAARVAA